jgi:hypothetical protein
VNAIVGSFTPEVIPGVGEEAQEPRSCLLHFSKHYGREAMTCSLISDVVA